MNFDIWEFFWRMAKYFRSVSNQTKNEENFEWRITLVASPTSDLPSWESEILHAARHLSKSIPYHLFYPVVEEE